MIARVAMAAPIELVVNGLPFGESTVAPAFRQRSASRMSAVTTTVRGPGALGDPVVGGVEAVADHDALDQRMRGTRKWLLLTIVTGTPWRQATL